MDEVRPLPLHGRCSPWIATEHHLHGQFLSCSDDRNSKDCTSSTRMSRLHKRTIFHQRNNGIDECVPYQNTCAISENQRCCISQKFKNGIQPAYRTHSLDNLLSYVTLILLLLVCLFNVSFSIAYKDLCHNVTWTSSVECNCSYFSFDNSSCSTDNTSNEASSCRCGDNMVCSISVLNSSDSQAVGNCSCLNNYSGSACETLIVDHCVNVTCQNGGSCSLASSNSSYSCECLREYSGVFCEMNFNNLCNDTHLCQHNGSCIVNGSVGYSCNCTEGYQGVDCSQPNCSLIECQNGGECIINGSDWSCNCTDRFNGKHCERDVDECHMSNICQHNSSCENFIGGYNCTCSLGYTGSNCESDINECNGTNICQNNGTCINTDGGYKCNCTLDYTGKNCSDYDACFSSPCQHGATCHRLNDAYNCSCVPGYMGVNCEELDSCVPSPCFHGNCTNENNGFRCSCFYGYTGIHCNITNQCTLNPCGDGGTCTDLLKNVSAVYANCSIPGKCFTCTCSTNYTGSLCETLISGPSEPKDSGPPVGLIVGLTVGLFFLVVIVAVIILILVVLNKRKNLGTYRPSRQEVTNARLEINGGLKPPPEERLI